MNGVKITCLNPDGTRELRYCFSYPFSSLDMICHVWVCCVFDDDDLRFFLLECLPLVNSLPQVTHVSGNLHLYDPETFVCPLCQTNDAQAVDSSLLYPVRHVLLI